MWNKRPQDKCRQYISDRPRRPLLPIHLNRPNTIAEMDPYYYPESKEDLFDNGLWSRYQYEIPSMFSGVSEPGSLPATFHEAQSVNASLSSQQQSENTEDIPTIDGFPPEIPIHGETGQPRRSTRLRNRSPTDFGRYFAPVAELEPSSEEDGLFDMVEEQKYRARKPRRMPARSLVSSSISEVFSEQASSSSRSVGDTSSAMTGNFSIQTHRSGFVSLVSESHIRTNRPALFRRDEPFFVENPTGWCAVTFTARSGVKTGEEWAGLRIRLTECMRAIERDDRQCTLTGQVYSHVRDILALLSTSRDFRTMTDTTFSAAINRSLLWAKEALLVSQNSASKRAFSVREQETVKWLQSCLSALLQSHCLAESKRQGGNDPIWPDYVKVANIVYLGEHKPIVLSSQ